MDPRKYSPGSARFDTISEDMYTHEMAFTSSQPEDDSPGDSESDAGSEFLMGMAYEPSDLETFEDEGFPRAHVRKTKTLKLEAVIIRPDDMMVSSEVPSPWMDLGKPSDTH